MAKGDRTNKVFLTLEEAPEEKHLKGKSKNYKGQIINNILFIYYVGNFKHRAHWLCQCPYCKKYFVASAHNILSNHTKSCGCLISQSLREDLTGKKFGRLTVLEYCCSKKGNPVWKCKCDCGNIVYVYAYSLKSGNTKSCGCLKSSLEEKTEKLLKDYNIRYKKEYHSDDLRGKKKQFLKFDFAILNNKNQLDYLIEVQGQQHFFNSFGVSDKEFLEGLERDKIKKQYCKKNNIPLIYINYDEKITIDKLLLWKTKGYIEEDFNNYKYPSFFLSNSFCTFKCDKLNNCSVCQNEPLFNSKTKYISFYSLIQKYLSNPISKAIVFGGLENMDEFEQLYNFIKIFRKEYKCDDTIIIQTGYEKNQILEKVNLLKEFNNIIIKFGPYIVNSQSRYDEVLGVTLASSNQYAEVIS